MAEETKKDVNPFDDDNFAHLGGLWEGRTVTVLSARAVNKPMIDAFGVHRLDPKTGEPSYFKGLELEGLADDTDLPRVEQYSAGALLPAPDGNSFVHPQGKPVKFYPQSNIARLAARLKEINFPLDKLYVDGKINLGGLVGAQFVMEGEDRKDKDGNTKINKKGYPERRFFPIKFVGFKAGLAPAATASAPLRARAIEMVTEVLKAQDGPIGRADLIRAISRTFPKDPDTSKVVALVTRDDFYKDTPFVRDGTSVKLA